MAEYSDALWTGSLVVFSSLSYDTPMYLYAPETGEWETIALPPPFSLVQSSKPTYVPENNTLVTSVGIYDLTAKAWIVSWDPLFMNLFVIDQRIFGFSRTFTYPNVIGCSHTMQLVFPFIKE